MQPIPFPQLLPRSEIPSRGPVPASTYAHGQGSFLRHFPFLKYCLRTESFKTFLSFCFSTGGSWVR